MYKYFDMKIEVFKDIDGYPLLFNSVRYNDNEPPSSDDFSGWQFDSKNQRDGATHPPYENGGYMNDMAPGEQSSDTVYFNGGSNSYKLKSTQKNVILDYRAPELMSWSGRYTIFTGEKWISEMTFRDDSGIDLGAYEIWSGGVCLVKRSRKGPQSTYPYWHSASQYARPEFEAGIKITSTRDIADPSKYDVVLTLDPEYLSDALIDCNEYVKYAKITVILYDIAGNSLECNIPRTFVLYNTDIESLQKKLKRLSLDFINPYPLDYIVSQDVIGTIEMEAKNYNVEFSKLFGFHIKFGLKDDSVGYMTGLPFPQNGIDYGNYISQRQKVDGIDRSGAVRGYAYLDGSGIGNVECSISGETIDIEVDKSVTELVKSATYVERDSIPFISECYSNTRKMNFNWFIPGVLKNEEMYGLCKLMERYLNTMYTPVGSDCRIGVLEKINRISDFKDPDKCEPRLLPRYGDEHGSELKFTNEDVKNVANVLSKYSDLRSLGAAELAERIYRRYYNVLPYIDRWKGNQKSLELLYRVIGIDVEVEPLWEGPEHQLVPEREAGDDYSLSSHLSLSLSSSRFFKRDIKTLSEFAMKGVKSILPVTRVISGITIREKFLQDPMDLSVVAYSSSPDEYGSQSQEDQEITFTWNNSSLKPSKIDTKTTELRLHMRTTYVSMTSVTSSDGILQDNAGFLFMRYCNCMKSYGNKIYLTMLRNGNSVNTFAISVTSINLTRDSIVLKMNSTEGNLNVMSMYNMLIQDSTVSLQTKFRYNSEIDTYCVSVG